MINILYGNEKFIPNTNYNKFFFSLMKKENSDEYFW